MALVTGSRFAARGHWMIALSIYTDLGAPEAEDVQAKLAASS